MRLYIYISHVVDVLLIEVPWKVENLFLVSTHSIKEGDMAQGLLVGVLIHFRFKVCLFLCDLNSSYFGSLVNLEWFQCVNFIFLSAYRQVLDHKGKFLVLFNNILSIVLASLVEHSLLISDTVFALAVAVSVGNEVALSVLTARVSGICVVFGKVPIPVQGGSFVILLFNSCRSVS